MASKRRVGVEWKRHIPVPRRSREDIVSEAIEQLRMAIRAILAPKEGENDQAR